MTFPVRSKTFRARVRRTCGLLPGVILAATLVVAILAVNTGTVDAATQQTMLTTDPHYDRNPSVFKASNGTWWLFFTRGRDSRGIRDNASYNPDLDYYDIYYKTAQRVSDLQEASENKIPLTPPDNAQRDVAALQADDGKIWVFASTGLGNGTERSIYYYVHNGTDWSVPTPVPGTDYAAHIDAVVSSGKIWLFYDIGYYLYALQLGGSPVLIVQNATIGKAIVSDGTFYVVWSHVNGVDIWGDYIGLSSSSDGNSWTNTGEIASWSGLTNWDPVLFDDVGLFRLFWAPSNSEQFIATSESRNPTNPASWSTPTRLTTASYESEGWWDFWPEVVQDRIGTLALFYTSESNQDGTHRIDGNIWIMNLPPVVEGFSSVLDAPKNRVWFVLGDYVLHSRDGYQFRNAASKGSPLVSAIATDIFAAQYFYGGLANPQNVILDTNSTYISQATADFGNATGIGIDDTIVTVGGPLVNQVVHYYMYTTNESQLFYDSAAGAIKRRDTNATVTSEGTTWTSDVFVVESFVDAQGRVVYLVWGKSYLGTMASTCFMMEVLMKPSNPYGDASWFVVRWNEATSGPSVNGMPDAGDTYTVIEANT